MPPALCLIHPDAKMCEAFRCRFGPLKDVQILQVPFEEMPPVDCFVTAGNAFGIMTAGIDAAVVRFFGQDLMRRVQTRIMNEFLGEQPVGTAFIEPTHHSHCPFLCHSPTMRVPCSIDRTDKVYVATWAALLAVHVHNSQQEQKIKTLGLPAMGTGFGRMEFDEAARQMAAAYRHALNPPHRLDWDHVVDRERAICYNGEKKVVK